ncbi:MAG: threonine/serine ThrE exporter family protein, partial [Arenimonas sp.]
MPEADSSAPYLTRVDFVVELARRLHAYGTSAQRLEGAVTQVARRLQVDADVWSNPTGMLLSFADVERGPPHCITRVIRLDPGDTNLGRLARADAIAERVLAGKQNIAGGLEALRALDRKPRRFASMMSVLSFGLAAASVTGLLPRMGWADLTTAAILGMLIGVLTEYSATRPRWRDAHEAVAAFVATIAASAVAAFIAPLTLQGVIVAALIVLMPGLTLTNAVAELSSQQLVSGTARFAGALTVLLKLTFGAVAGAQLVHLLGWVAMPNAGAVLPAWMPWLTLLAGSFAFAVLFKTARRDTLLVMASVWLGFAVQRLVVSLPGMDSSTLPTGVFFAGIVVTAASNAYGRWFNRPGALVRVPGIILLVP